MCVKLLFILKLYLNILKYSILYPLMFCVSVFVTLSLLFIYLRLLTFLYQDIIFQERCRWLRLTVVIFVCCLRSGSFRRDNKAKESPSGGLVDRRRQPCERKV